MKVWFHGCISAGLCLLGGLSLPAQDARQIMEESQKRARVNSQHYEGLLQVIEPSGKTTEKRWQSQRLGSSGNSKTLLRFTAPAEVKGVALLVVSHTDRAADEWMWTPAIGRERRSNPFLTGAYRLE